MKKYFTIILLMVLLVGCSRQEKNVGNTQTVTDKPLDYPTNSDAELRSIAVSTDGVIVGCGTNGVVALLTPLDKWTPTVIDNDVDFYDIVFFKDQFIALGSDKQNSKLVICLLDISNNQIQGGVTELDEHMEQIYKLEVANNQLIGLGRGEVYISNDGVSWEESEIECSSPYPEYPNIVTPKSILYMNSNYLMSGGGAFIAKSSDIKEWEFIREPEQGTIEMNGGTTMGTTSVFVGSHLNILTTINGEDWISKYPENPENGRINIQEIETVPDYQTLALNSTTNNGAIFVAVGQRELIIKSLDGVTWEVCHSGGSNWLMDVIWNGEYFIALGEQAVLYSKDGDKWEKGK